MNESIESSKKIIKSSLINGIPDEDLKLLAGYADRAFEDIDFFYDSDKDTLAEHDYDQDELYKAQDIAIKLYNMVKNIKSSKKPIKQSAAHFGNFDDMGSFASYFNAHYKPMLDDLAHTNAKITDRYRKLLGFLLDDINAILDE